MTSRAVFEKCEKFYENAKQHPKFWISIGILLAVILLIWLPLWQVSNFGINNATVEADLENQYRATLAQILGGVAIGITLYYTWRRINIAEDELKATREGQITERFTRAVDQLGSEKMEIRLGGIYALERIANESDEDYWPVFAILTAYVRKHSQFVYSKQKIDSLIEQMNMQQEFQEGLDDYIKNQIKPDIKAIIDIIKNRKHSIMSNINVEHYFLDLSRTNLQDADLYNTHFECAILNGAFLLGTHFNNAHLDHAHLIGAFLILANLQEANLSNACLDGANLQEADLCGANLQKASLRWVDFKGADLSNAFLFNANLEGANLQGTKNLSFDQLSKVKTLYKAELDEELEKPLREKYPALFEKPDE